MCLTHIAPETFSVRPEIELLARTRSAWPVFVIESLLFHIYTIYAIKGQLSSWAPGRTREGGAHAAKSCIRGATCPTMYLPVGDST